MGSISKSVGRRLDIQMENNGIFSIEPRFVQCTHCGHIFKTRAFRPRCSRCSGETSYLTGHPDMKIGSRFMCQICHRSHEVVIAVVKGEAAKRYKCKGKWLDV